ncbi:MAG TPA: hypothetical protein VMJ33_06335 [Gallionella sp.]|nr:hypothetical protein [Gallionella sp.]
MIQPWFSAIGHPAQSLINMASAIGRDARVEYLVSTGSETDFCRDSIEQLRSWGKVESYAVTTSTGDSNTVRALLVLWRMQLQGCSYQRAFFADGSLFVLALLWPLLSPWFQVERVGVLQLFGPILGRRNWLRRFIIGRFLKRPEVRLYLRTEELAQAWRDAYRSVTVGHISYLPSLEIPDDELWQYPVSHSDKLAFGIIGQVRVGKGIEWLVPAFQNDADLGKLTIAGEFASPQSKEKLSVLEDFEGFVNRYMSESEMLQLASDQHYLLLLYEQWDKRMESAVLYLAARVNRPVIVYGDSWCGRMVREFKCGMEAPADRNLVVELLRRLPRPGSAEYESLRAGMEAFRRAHTMSSLRGKVVQELLG